MKLITTIREMQMEADAARQRGKTLALVPTMGALHRGHLALVEEARRQADHVTVSIFVNPTQFAPGEDFARYPRQIDADLESLEAGGGVEVVFAPDIGQMYPEGEAANLTWVTVEAMDQRLCGAFRPGHFRGVTTVVAKLFHICKPDVAVFGTKDAQQFQILRHMVRDLCMDIRMAGVPTVREPDGLALSSRNVYLSERERRQAVALSKAVARAKRFIEQGEQRSEAVVETMRDTLSEALDGKVQYAEVVDAETLQPVERLAPGREVLAAVAVHFGNTRLIDNAFVTVPQGRIGNSVVSAANDDDYDVQG